MFILTYRSDTYFKICLASPSKQSLIDTAIERMKPQTVQILKFQAEKETAIVNAEDRFTSAYYTVNEVDLMN